MTERVWCADLTTELHAPTARSSCAPAAAARSARSRDALRSGRDAGGAPRLGLVVVRSAAGRPVSSVEGAHPVAHIQRKLSHLAEAAAFQRLKARRAAHSAHDLAHFNSTDASWMFCTPLERFRLSNAQLCVRVRRQLNLDIAACMHLTLGSGA